MKLHTIFFLIVSLTLFSSPALAVEEIQQDHIKAFSISAPEGLTFSGIDLSNLDANSNTTIYMYQSQGTYTFQINSTKSYGTYFNFNISVTSPNGTTQYKELSTVSLLNSNYDLHIQHYYTLWNETFIDESYDMDLYATLSPLSAEFDFISPEGYQVESFYKVDALSTSYYDLVLYAVTGAELNAQQENSLTASVGAALSDAFQWTWDSIVYAIGKIPYIGVYLASLLIYVALTIDSIIFYVDLIFIQYAETSFLTFEFFILSYSFCKKGNIWKKLKRVVDSHIQLVEIMLNVARSAVNLFSSIISAIAGMIQAIKPL